MLTFQFTGANGQMVESERITTGMVGKPVRLCYSEEWKGLRKMAVFMAGDDKGSITRVVNEADSVVAIPAEVLQVPMRTLYVGVYGTAPDGTLVIPTIRAAGPRIELGVDPNADPATDPESPFWLNIENAIETLEREKLDAAALPDAVETALAQARDSGEFTGPQGEKGDTGEVNYGKVSDIVQANYAILATDAGTSISIRDAAALDLAQLHLYGKTSQSGTPTPDAPIPLAHIGDDPITIQIQSADGSADTQSMTFQPLHGLPGVELIWNMGKKQANYIDDSGKYWYGDEVDFARGVYIKRMNRVILDGSQYDIRNYWESQTDGKQYMCRTSTLSDIKLDNSIRPQSSMFASAHTMSDGVNIVFSTDAFHSIYLKWEPSSGLDTTEKQLSWLAEHPVDVVYALETPVEIPLEPAVLEAFAALHAYFGESTLSNSAQCWMRAQYVLDLQTYIDKKIAQALA